jgi:hypothetical protein
MAEIAIPLVGLATAYFLSNKKDINKKDINKKTDTVTEGYENTKIPITNTVDVPNNFPSFESKSGYTPDYSNYSTPNAATDKYYKQSVYKKIVNGGDDFGGKTQFGVDYQDQDQLLSLTGNVIDTSNFKHNNMAPYLGGKPRGRTADASVQESMLDTMTGSGSQWTSKTESAPLFKPQEQLNYVFGAPNTNDFMQTRLLPSSKMSNVKPWEETRVAPGLDNGYTDVGSGGFNSGMHAREKWVDRNVDELRVKTNPKLTYGLETHEGPATYYIKNAPTAVTQGKVEKHLPDTFYLNTPDRWLTTTGLEKAQTSRPVESDRFVNRPSTTSDYFGPGSEQSGASTYTTPSVEASKRTQFDTSKHSTMNLNGINQNPDSSTDPARSGYKLLNNNRSTTNSYVPGVIYGAMRAVVAPLMEAVRPSRKENVIGNLRTYANAGTTVPSGTVFNPADRLSTTIKETTVGLLGFNHMNFERQTNAGYQVSQQQPVCNERDTTNVQYVGSGGASHVGTKLYDSAYNQRNNNNKIHSSRINQGNMSLLNHDENICVRNHHVAMNNYIGIPSAGTNHLPPSAQTHGKLFQKQPQHDYNCDRISPDLLNAFRNNPYTHSLNSY